MRTEKKISDNAVAISFSDSANTIYVRPRGKDEKYNYKTAVRIVGNEILIFEDAINDFGLNIVRCKGGAGNE